jgi:hypothetical protein
MVTVECVNDFVFPHFFVNQNKSLLLSILVIQETFSVYLNYFPAGYQEAEYIAWWLIRKAEHIADFVVLRFDASLTD